MTQSLNWESVTMTTSYGCRHSSSHFLKNTIEYPLCLHVIVKFLVMRLFKTLTGPKSVRFPAGPTLQRSIVSIPPSNLGLCHFVHAIRLVRCKSETEKDLNPNEYKPRPVHHCQITLDGVQITSSEVGDLNL
jgi:hypothetical protein